MDDSNEGASPTAEALVRQAQTEIAASGSSSPRLDAEVLMRHVLGLDRVGWFLRRADMIADHEIAAFTHLVQRRLAGEPVAYLTGVREFMGLTFHVTPAVLVPRPETELLVDWALEWLGERRDARIVDVGTGSGAIAVSIAALDTSEANPIVAADISADALAIAGANAQRLLTPFRRKRLAFVEGSLLTWRTEPIDLLLANLPYLTPSQIAGNPDLDAEPRLALDGGADGLDLVRHLIPQAVPLMAPGGAIGLELDPSQCEAVVRVLAESFPGSSPRIIEDLAGFPRHVIATVP
jgi:release factor glutamine methyltransferase